MDRRPLGPFVVSPIGFGAMHLTGPNVFGPPKDRGEALIVLREAVHQGVDHIDTAQYYGPNVVNELIREALHPYPVELILGRPEVVREAARLGITPAQVALAWTLTASPNVLLIPGTSSLQHLRENLAAATVHLDAEAIRQLSHS